MTSKVKMKKVFNLSNDDDDDNDNYYYKGFQVAGDWL